MGRVVAASLVMLLADRGIAACRCSSPSPRDAYGKADTVVVAKARGPVKSGVPATLDVSQAWKMDVPKTIAVDGGDLDCPQEFDADISYVLYLSATPQGGWKTHGCSGNKPIDSPKLPARFRKTAEKDIAWLKKYGKRGKIT